MTVSTIEAGVLRTGNGVTTVFPFSFEARFVDEVKVATVVGQVQTDVDPADYVVTIEPDGIGGEVTFSVAPADMLTLYIYRDTSLTQLVSVSSQQRYDPMVTENVWDKLTFLVQELASSVAQAVLAAPGTDPSALISSLFTAEASAVASASAAAVSAAEALAKENSMLRWRGNWATTTAYDPSDIVFSSGSAYVCVLAHISGVFATDLSASRWQLFAQQGATGAGTGDMLNSDNLSGLTNKPLAYTTLGGKAVGKVDLLTYALIDPAAVITDVETLAANKATNALPTAKAVADYVDFWDSGLIDTSTGATSYTVTGIPSWANRVEILFDRPEISANVSHQIRLGRSGVYVSSGYQGICHTAGIGSSTLSDGFTIVTALANNRGPYGIMTLRKLAGNIWTCSASLALRNYPNTPAAVNGRVNVDGTLDSFSLLRESASGTYNNGNIRAYAYRF